MHSRLSLLTLPIIVLSLGTIRLSLTGSGKTQTKTPTETTSSGEPRTGVTASQEPRPGSFLVSPLDLTALTRDADLIVIGRVVSIEDRGRAVKELEGQSVEAERMIASLSVNRVLKGQADRCRLSFEFLMALTRPDFREIKASQFGMFFLAKNGEAGYAVLNSYYPFVIASSNRIETDGTPLDRVVGVIGHVLGEPRSSDERRLAVRILSSAKTDLATRILRQATKDRDSAVRMQALGALLARNDITMLDIAENILLHTPTTDEHLYLSAALEGIKDVRAIPALNRLLRSGDVRTRLGAASALRQMGDPGAIDALVSALEDTDREVRYEAVVGLGEITGQYDWTPSIEVFQKKRAILSQPLERVGATQIGVGGVFNVAVLLSARSHRFDLQFFF